MRKGYSAKQPKAKSRLVKSGVGIAAALGLALGGVAPANAAVSDLGSYDCGSVNVMIQSTTSGTTRHYHYPNAWYYLAEWPNLSANSYRESFKIKKGVWFKVEAPTINSAQKRCDW